MKKIEIKIERELTANLSDITIERIKTRIEKKIAEELDVRLSRAYLRRMEIDKRQEKEKEIKEQRIAERKRKQEEKLRNPIDPSIIKTIQEKIKNPPIKVTSDMEKYREDYYKSKIKSSEIICELCKTRHNKYSYKTHLKSKKHQKNIILKNNEEKV